MIYFFAMKSKGMALIVVIVIMTVIAAAVAGIATYIANSFMLTAMRDARQKALYAAESGIHALISMYADNKAKNKPYYLWKLKNYVIDSAYPGVTFNAGNQANFLQANATNPLISVITRPSGIYYVVGNIYFYNHGDQTITADRAKVEWYNMGSLGNILKQMEIGDTSWFGAWLPGRTITLDPPLILAPRRLYGHIGSWYFQSAVPADAIVIVTLFFTDGSKRKAVIMNKGYSGNNEFSITSTGIVKGKVDWKRTIEATYDITAGGRVGPANGRITSWQETEEHITQ